MIEKNINFIENFRITKKGISYIAGPKQKAF